jgi:hemoglobin
VSGQALPDEGRTPYALVGGASKVIELVDRFYDLMDEVPEYYPIRKLHPASLDGSRDKLKWFLSGWLGGPQLYLEKVGHPMLRARHLPYPIGSVERDLWLACMFAAMRDTALPEGMQAALRESFFGTADWMRNKES